MNGFVWLPGAQRALNLAHVVTVEFFLDEGKWPTAHVLTTAVDADWPIESASGPRPYQFRVMGGDVEILSAALFGTLPEWRAQS